MHKQIKELAEAALKLQNKNFMDETFTKIIDICDQAGRMEAFANAELRRQLDERQAEMIAHNRAGLPVVELTDTTIAVTDTAIPKLIFPVISMPVIDQDSATVGEKEPQAASKASEAMQDCAQEMLDDGKIAVDAKSVDGEQLSAGGPVVIDDKAAGKIAVAKSSGKKGGAK